MTSKIGKCEKRDMLVPSTRTPSLPAALVQNFLGVFEKKSDFGTPFWSGGLGVLPIPQKYTPKNGFKNRSRKKSD